MILILLGQNHFSRCTVVLSAFAVSKKFYNENYNKKRVLCQAEGRSSPCRPHASRAASMPPIHHSTACQKPTSLYPVKLCHVPYVPAHLCVPILQPTSITGPQPTRVLPWPQPTSPLHTIQCLMLPALKWVTPCSQPTTVGYHGEHLLVTITNRQQVS